MLTYELYINDRAVDMPPDLDVTLNFQSNLFQDFDKIQSSYSQTINLPRTSRNARIFKTLTPATQNTIGEALPARLYMDGMDIIGEAHAYLLKVGNTYEVCLVWGIFQDFNEWKNRDASLRELPIDASAPLGGELYTREVAEGSAIYNAYYSTGNPTLRHPVANVGVIAQRIAQQFSLTLPQTTITAAKRIGMTLASRNESKGLNQAKADNFTLFRRTNTETYISPDWTSESNPDYTRQFGGSFSYSKAQGVERIYVSIPELVLRVSGFDAGTTPTLQLLVQEDGGTQMRYILDVARMEGVLRRFSVDAEIELPEALTATRVTFTIVIYGLVGNDLSTWIIEANSSAAIIALHKELPEGYEYDLRGNLPENFKQADFLKGIFNLYGLGITQMSGGLGVVSYNTLLQGGYGVKNWAHKLINMEQIEISHQTSDIGRKTWLKYKSDAGSDFIELQDESLKDEATMFTLPFTYGESTTVDFYDEKDGVYKLKNNSENTLLALKSSQSATLQEPKDINMAAVKNTSWQGYTNWLQDPVIVECELRLNVVDIKTLRYDQLVHFDQLGRNYAILEVQTSGKETSKVKLLQIGA